MINSHDSRLADTYTLDGWNSQKSLDPLAKVNIFSTYRIDFDINYDETNGRSVFTIHDNALCLATLNFMPRISNVTLRSQSCEPLYLFI